ncbi:hypothetical protein [Streptomyces nitrosporeus]|uniref:hypothetical protein n=1 Tax=Streptomyces nitrosporeus TaxID=28894 RepID=UPI0033255B5D
MGKESSSIPDEEWERFLRDAGAGAAEAPQEPSARARMVTRRLREEPEPPRGWRIHEPPRQRRGKGRYAVGLVAAVVCLLAVVLAPGPVAGWFGGEDDTGSSSAAVGEGPGGSAAGGSQDAVPTVEEPFRGSPAAGWEDGRAGIGLPEARATGWMDKGQVADALDRTLDFLAASSLDAGVLAGQRPDGAIALVNPHQEDVRDYVKAAFGSPSEENDPLLLFSRFDASEVRPAGDVVKTRGKVTYREGKRGALEVTADVTYVYALVRADGESDEVARTVVRRETVMSWDDPEKVITEPGTFSLVSYAADIANGGCDNHTGYFSPEFVAERRAGGSGEGPEVDPYDRDVPMEERMRQGDATECGRAGRL